MVCTLAAPNVGFLYRLDSGPTDAPAQSEGRKDWKTAEYFSKPYPGSGAFKFVEWQRGNFISIEKNSNYYRGSVNLDKIIYRVIPNDDARLAALKTGEADMSFFLIGQHVELARQISGTTVTETPSFAAFFFILVHAGPDFKGRSDAAGSELRPRQGRDSQERHQRPGVH